MSSSSSQPDHGVHAISDRYVDDSVALAPNEATFMGIDGYDDKLTDFSPEGFRDRGRLVSDALRAMADVEPADDAERVAKAVFQERVGLSDELHQAGLDSSALNIIASPVQEIRELFDLMPTDTTEHWENIAARLKGVPTALAGLRVSLGESADAGRCSALRQIRRVAEQCDTWSGQGDVTSFFVSLTDGAQQRTDVGAALRTELAAGAKAASEAYADFGRFLRDDLAPKAPRKDAVGRETYQLFSRYFLGARLDLTEAYEWGWEEFFRIEKEMHELAGRLLRPGASLAETAQALDRDPRYRVDGQDAFQRWMQDLSDTALRELRGTHFEIADELMRLECRIAPPGGGNGAYYTGPSEDMTRPGRMWWSVNTDKSDFSTWREVTTVYHEGAPGHHLQIATAVNQQDRLNKFQRLMCFVSGHGEGWALYSERLMRELGYLSDDGDLMGMLSAQLLRAARVIVDIGMHLELEIPAGTGFHEGERWTPELGLEFMLDRTIEDRDLIPDEVDRYLGWPGQAPSYKLGERLWLAARDDARRRGGADFDLKTFHRQALDLGCLGLDDLRAQLALL
ncbi:DUF885 domain-containing protein [Actinoalloteichus hymeniacidonis]|uniref:DUF885 domain-containing protein n=1 Tax=Actinoalloteichus hymeniacidonis TaxID=340345 RepID=A0AAC9HTH7_9PSEU|nr:DUF885 domain-containing protein [Actinoalloteichus hymeniacidonis]AOS65095.1 hypothetical protein TL08_21540 [Actinoalloteichus hymeniacidonis]MBB5906826.1 uncharacterized protein (DUF885 family) [Actinoalloteichus hymeniacidonis]